MRSAQQTVAVVLSVASAVASLIEFVILYFKGNWGNPGIAFILYLSFATAVHAVLAVCNGVAFWILGQRLRARGNPIAWTWLVLSGAVELVLFAPVALMLLISAL